MKIVVQENGEKPIKLLIPTWLFANRVGANFVAKKLQEQGIHLDKKQALALVKYLNAYRKKHKDWVLVDVQSADGSCVTIKV